MQAHKKARWRKKLQSSASGALAAELQFCIWRMSDRWLV
jgi:hypothetical protein